MEWIVALVFGLVLAATRQNEVVLFLIGALLGWLIVRMLSLQGRVAALERMRRDAHEREKPGVQARPLDGPAAPVAERPVEPAPASMRPAPVREERPAVAPAPSTRAKAGNATVNWRDNALVRWLLKGNVPVKVGVLVSFFGVAFLLKHAVDQGWMSVPIQVRLFGVAAFGAGLLWFGWRLRDSHRIYALSIQGGGVGVLYLTTYAALRLFDVLPAGAAFFVLAALAAGAGWLAVTQSARQLAVLGSIGGFLAPLLASTGSGSHVGLFSYYLVLNAGIAGVALYRHWRMLNLLGFVFTFGIGLVWGAKFYDERYFASVEPFLIAHFLLYTAVAVLSALKQPFRLRGYVDSALVFGLPLVAFPLQAALVDGESRPLAWTATLLAAFYAALARELGRRWPDELRLLAQVYIALAVIFGTLAIPLWLDAPWVSNTWALEAAAMIAIGLKQRRSLTHWGGVGLLVLAVGTYLISLHDLGTSPLLLNERFIGGFMLCAAFSFCAWIYAHEHAVSRDVPLEAFAAIAAWAGWLLLGSAEVFEHAGGDSARAPGLVYAAAITVILERAAHRFVPKARVLAVSVLPLLYAYGVWWIAETDHLLADYGWLAWPLAFAALAWTVHVLQQYRRWMLTGACWLTAAALAIEMNYGVDEWLALSHDWASAAVLMSLFGFVRFARRQLGQRYPESFDLVFALGPVVAAALLYAVSWTLTESGNFAPLPYLPVLNVMLLTSAAILWLAWQFPWGIVARRDMLIAVAVLGLLFVTMEIARGTHHLAGVRFASEALWRSGVFQASLSIIWSMLGIAGMVFGARRMQRLPWLAGAGLMGVVVVKLFLVDLGNTGSVTRIVSFIGVGLLLLVVGYLAPAPTRTGDRLQESADG